MPQIEISLIFDKHGKPKSLNANLLYANVVIYTERLVVVKNDTISFLEECKSYIKKINKKQLLQELLTKPEVIAILELIDNGVKFKTA